MKWFRDVTTQSLRGHEATLLHGIDYLSTKDVPIDATGQTVHTISASCQLPAVGDDSPTLVCWPGFGMTAATFALVMPYLRETFRGIHAVDWRGFGLSSRPAGLVTNGQGVRATETIFVDGLEAWRKDMEIERMVLLGHSLGGYLGVAYAERFPDRVDHLVLASPAGVPKAPDPEAEATRLAKAPILYRYVLRPLAHTIWSAGITPMSVVRALPPFGHYFIQG